MKKTLSTILIFFIIFVNFLFPISALAAVTTIKFELLEEKTHATTGLLAWDLNINTTNIANGGKVSIQLFENDERVQIGEGLGNYLAISIDNNVGNYFTNYILKPGTKYKVLAFSGAFSGSFEKTTVGQAAKPPTTTTSTDSFWFRNMDTDFMGTQGTLKLPGYATFEACEVARKEYWNGTTNNLDNKPCVVLTEKQVLENFEAEKKRNAIMPGSEPLDINPDKSAPAPNNGVYTLLAPIGDLKTAPDNIGDYFNTIFKIAIGLCGVLAVIMIVIGGVQYMGDESIFGQTEAKGKITSAILGLLIALGSYALLNTINPDLLGKGGVNIKSVSATIEPLYDRGATDPKNQNGESIRCTPVTSGPCSVANLTTVFGADNAVAMSKICNMESSGIENLASGTDVCKPTNTALGATNPFSFGLFQVNLAANGILAGEDCVGIFDKAVRGADAIEPKYNSGFSCKILPGKESLYNTCKSRLLNTATNLAIAKSLFFNVKGIHNWDGDKKYCASAFN